MNFLVGDIGGTNIRFAEYDICGRDVQSEVASTSFPTKHPAVNSFSDVLSLLERTQVLTRKISSYDAVIVAVAGPVLGRKCNPPNIEWDVDLQSCSDTHYILNDFVAQAYGCLHPLVSSHLSVIKDGSKDHRGTVAIVGAGTGLGHCALIPSGEDCNRELRYLPVSSEAGHSAFAFIDEEEIKYQNFVKSKTNVEYCYGDLIVSGLGLSLLHEFISSECLLPEQVVQRFTTYRKTLEMFSRFYARACRNYCLQTLATGGLIISGGIAAKNPSVITNEAFLAEFLNSPNHRGLLEEIPIFLNRKEDIGLLGCVMYGHSIVHGRGERQQ